MVYKLGILAIGIINGAEIAKGVVREAFKAQK